MEGGDNVRKSLAAALTIVGTIVGAGFASGREVYHFFARYGIHGLAGSVLVVVLLCALCLRVVYLSRKYRAKDLCELVHKHLGGLTASLLKVLLLVSMWLGLGVMLSGAGAAGEGVGISRLLSIGVTAVVVLYCLNRGLQGIKEANSVLIPALILLTAYLFVRGLSLGTYSFLLVPLSSASIFQALWSSVVYAGLNGLLLMVIIPPLMAEDSTLGIVLGCTIFGGLLSMVTLLLLIFPFLAADSPVPMLTVAAYLLPSLPGVYGFILWTALTTTALTNALGISLHFAKRSRYSLRIQNALVVASALPLGLVAFEVAVAVVYTALGYTALFVTVLLLFPAGKWPHLAK